MRNGNIYIQEWWGKGANGCEKQGKKNLRDS